MSSEDSSTVEAEVSPSTIFCADDADVVIVAGSRNFRAHKFILSLVSPIFKDMFTVPQPPIDTSGTLPHVDVDESAETWENILRTIYPMPRPIIDDLKDLESLLLTAKKYEMQAIIDIHKTGLEKPAFIQEPLRLYAAACACGLEDQAKYVARNAELVAVTRDLNLGDLKGLTLGSYQSLVSFLAERDSEWYQTIVKTQIPTGYRCECEVALKEEFYNKIKETLKRPSLRVEEAYLKALEDLSQSSRLGCQTYRGNCAVSASEVKWVIERLVGVREQLCNRFMCEKQYVQWLSTALHLLKLPYRYCTSQVH